MGVILHQRCLIAVYPCLKLYTTILLRLVFLTTDDDTEILFDDVQLLVQ